MATFSVGIQFESLEQLKKTVKLCAWNVFRETLIKAAQIFMKRATLCLANEGHFDTF